MKHYMKYPYGILVKPVNGSKDPIFEISDDNNKRKRKKLSELMNLAISNSNKVSGYPRATIVTDINSRNKYVKNNNGAYVKVYNGPGARKYIKQLDETPKYAKFTIIKDEINNIIVPIEPIKGDI